MRSSRACCRLCPGALRGTLKGGGTGWTPAVYGEVQAEAVANFYSQNGWVAYDTVKRWAGCEAGGRS